MLIFVNFASCRVRLSQMNRTSLIRLDLYLLFLWELPQHLPLVFVIHTYCKIRKWIAITGKTVKVLMVARCINFCDPFAIIGIVFLYIISWILKYALGNISMLCWTFCAEQYSGKWSVFPSCTKACRAGDYTFSWLSLIAQWARRPTFDLRLVWVTNRWRKHAKCLAV